MSDSRAIGLFDSGVGGLTVLREVRRRLPRESTVYLGDNARAPYGSRPDEQVIALSGECLDWLLRTGRQGRRGRLQHLLIGGPRPAPGTQPRAGPGHHRAGRGSGGAGDPVGTHRGHRHRDHGADPAPSRGPSRWTAPTATSGPVGTPELVPLVESGELDGPHVATVVRRVAGAGDGCRGWRPSTRCSWAVPTTRCWDRSSPPPSVRTCRSSILPRPSRSRWRCCWRPMTWPRRRITRRPTSCAPRAIQTSSDARRSACSGVPCPRSGMCPWRAASRAAWPFASVGVSR